MPPDAWYGHSFNRRRRFPRATKKIGGVVRRELCLKMAVQLEPPDRERQSVQARIRQEAHEPLEATMEGLTRLWIDTANSDRRRLGRVKMALSGRLRLV